MSKWGVSVLRILDTLEHVGPMTGGELARELEADRDVIASVLTRLRKPSKRPKGPKRVHIADWRDEDEGQRCYLRAVYGFGNKKDAEKPPRKTAAERNRTYRERQRRGAELPWNNHTS